MVYETDGIAPTIRAYQGGGLEPKIIQRGHGYNQGGEHDIAPIHYQGRYGMQSIDALRNFMTPEQLKGFFLGNSLKYLLRHQKKNGLEDLKKARKNLDWLIEEMEHEDKNIK